MTGRAPLRFLLVVTVGWVGLRAAILAPSWWVEEVTASPARGATAPARQAASAAADRTRATGIAPVAIDNGPGRPDGAPPLMPDAPGAPPFAALPLLEIAPSPAPISTTRSMPADPAIWPFAMPASPHAAPSRWSASAWLLLRREEGGGLAPGGTLGGSQAGLRLAFRIGGSPQRPLALSARLYAPVERRSGAEAAVGLDWRPSAALPIHIVAERRQALGREGRSAFSVGLHGGVSGRRLPVGLSLDAYGQAGLVGARRRDLFVDGSARITRPAGRLDLGAGIWGGSQPGASRLDAGPHVSMRLPLAGETVRVAADWRFRIAGDARPGSGPALTVGTDF